MARGHGKKQHGTPFNRATHQHAAAGPARAASLLDHMQDGNEYGSIVGLAPDSSLDLVAELVRAVRDIEAWRERPCLCYVGNVITGDFQSGIDATDDLPFAEMVASVPAEVKKVDLYLATRGGSAHQVSRFVNALRGRFDEVDVLVTSFAMSAGTLFALSGDRIWMTPRACLGPIDPQVPSKDGRFVPAQALLLLVSSLQQQGDAAIKNGQPVPWSAVRIIDSMDKKELGDAISASDYSRMMAAEFLVQYKFRHWLRRKTSGEEVTEEYRKARADKIASALASHDRWKNHGHAIGRDVLWDEIQLEIQHPDAPLERALTRLWALYNWIFDKTPALKFILSANYRYVRNRNIQPAGTT